MSDEQVQTFEEAVNAFYPDAESEPLEAPTDEVVTDELPEEAEEESAEVVGEEAEESEDEASDDETEEQEEESLTLDGEDHSLESVQEWKKSFDDIKSMQADCTKKWQEASELRKESESQIEKNADLTLQLEVLVGEDSEADLDSYKDIESDNYDPDKYIELKDKFDARKAKLAELKASQPAQQATLTQEELVAEGNDFYAYDAAWRDGDTLTPKFQEDMKMAGDYLKDAGYSQDEVNAISHSHHWKTIIDAARFKALDTKTKVTKKRITKTPKISKSKAKSNTLSVEEKFYGKK